MAAMRRLFAAVAKVFPPRLSGRVIENPKSHILASPCLLVKINYLS